MTSYTAKIDKALLGWKGSCDGGWSKGALTTALCKFIESYCKRHALEESDNEMFRLIEPRFLYLKTF